MKQRHKIQLGILQRLLFANKLHYSQLKPYPSLENNQFDFHLKELMKAGYIEKENRDYFLTNLGKEYVGRFADERATVVIQPKVIVTICCLKSRGGSKKYLFHTRRKQPFFGYQNFPGGKVNFGEKIIAAAKRELKEETNLEGNPKIVAIRHYLIKNPVNKKLLDDFYIYLCLVQNPKGKTRPGREGTLAWIDEKAIKKRVKNHIENYASFRQQINLVKKFKGQITYQEIDYQSPKY